MQQQYVASTTNRVKPANPPMRALHLRPPTRIPTASQIPAEPSQRTVVATHTHIQKVRVTTITKLHPIRTSRLKESKRLASIAPMLTNESQREKPQRKTEVCIQSFLTYARRPRRRSLISLLLGTRLVQRSKQPQKTVLRWKKKWRPLARAPATPNNLACLSGGQCF